MKLYNQERHYKDPDLGKVSKNISMTDTQYEKLKAAAKLSGLHLGDFITAMTRDYITLHELRAAERGFNGK